jgi:hypothetical protein
MQTLLHLQDLSYVTEIIPEYSQFAYNVEHRCISYSDTERQKNAVVW